MLLDSTATCYRSYGAGPCKADKVRKKNCCATLHIITKVFYSPTDAQVNCFKNNSKIYIKMDIKTSPTCFCAITIIREGIVRDC